MQPAQSVLNKKMIRGKLRSGVNWKEALKQKKKGVKQKLRVFYSLPYHQGTNFEQITELASGIW
jgi:hypothetical protein